MLGFHMEADTPALRPIPVDPRHGTPVRREPDAPVAVGVAPPSGLSSDAIVASAEIVRLDAVRLLSLDAHGRVLDWISWQDAACLYARDAVAWTVEWEKAVLGGEAPADIVREQIAAYESR